MIRFAALLISLVMCSVAVGQQNVFDVRRFQASGDGVTDDTAEIQAAIDAAEAYTAISTTNQAIVEIPRGVYIVGTSTLADSSAVVIGDDDTGDTLPSPTNITIRGDGATIRLASASAADSAVQILGNGVVVEDLTIDGNSTGNPTGRGECLRVSGDYGLFVNVVCQNTDDSGGAPSTFMVYDPTGTTRSVHNRFEHCKSLNSGAMAFDNRGDYTLIRDFVAYEYKAQGFSQGGGGGSSNGVINNLTIDGYYSKSTVTTNVGFIIDPGIDNDTPANGYGVDVVNLSNIYVDLTGNSVAGNGVKFARINNLTIDNLQVHHTSTAYHSCRFAEGLGNVRIANSHFAQDMFQEGTTFDAGGALTSATADNGSGFARFTSSGHDIKKGDYIVITGSTSYDGLHQVTASTTGSTFDTNWGFTNTDSSGTFSNTIANLDVRNTTIGTIGQTATTNAYGTLRAHRARFEKVRFANYSVRGLGVEASTLFAHEAFKSIELLDCEFISNSAVSNSAIRSVSGAEFSQPNVLRWLNSTQRGIGSNSGQITHATTLPYVSRDRERHRNAISGNTTLTAEQSGAVFLVSSADAVVTLPSSASTSASGGAITYTFVLSSGGLSTGTGLQISPQSADKIMGNGFVSADNKDLILPGATDREGDSVTIINDGVDGWVVANYVGNWTSENGQKTRIDPITVYSTTTEVGNVGTGVDDLISYTLPANSIDRVGGSLEIEAGFTFAANANNKQVILLINGVSHYASGAVAQNGGSMVLKMTVICDSANVTKFSTTVQTTGSAAIPNVALVNGGLLTIANANIIKCTGEATAGDGSSTSDIVQEYLRVRVIPAP